MPKQHDSKNPHFFFVFSGNTHAGIASLLERFSLGSDIPEPPAASACSTFKAEKKLLTNTWLEIDQRTVKVSIYDRTALPRYSAIHSGPYQLADIMAIVIDPSTADSLKNANDWYRQNIHEKNARSQIVLILSKVDQVASRPAIQENIEQLERFAQEKNIPCYKTSAIASDYDKTGINEMFCDILRGLLKTSQPKDLSSKKNSVLPAVAKTEPRGNPFQHTFDHLASISSNNAKWQDFARLLNAIQDTGAIAQTYEPTSFFETFLLLKRSSEYQKLRDNLLSLLPDKCLTLSESFKKQLLADSTAKKPLAIKLIALQKTEMSVMQLQTEHASDDEIFQESDDEEEGAKHINDAML